MTVVAKRIKAWKSKLTPGKWANTCSRPGIGISGNSMIRQLAPPTTRGGVQPRANSDCSTAKPRMVRADIAWQSRIRLVITVGSEIARWSAAICWAERWMVSRSRLVLFWRRISSAISAIRSGWV